MAALTGAELSEIRKNIEAKTTTVGAQNKASLNSAIQGMEDWWATNKASAISGLGTYSAADKSTIYRSWVQFKLKQ